MAHLLSLHYVASEYFLLRIQKNCAAPKFMTSHIASESITGTTAQQMNVMRVTEAVYDPASNGGANKRHQD